jgi:sugar phosphate isomerase/epimerase
VKIALTAMPGAAQFAPILLQGDIADAFRTASKLGCDGVELHLRRAEDVDLPELKGLMTRYALGVPTLGTGMAAGRDRLTFSDADPDVRQSAVERVCGHVKLAAEIGSAVTIGLVSGKLGACLGEPRHRARGKALDCLAEVCRCAGPLGVEVLLEPLNRYECDYINTLADGVAIANEIGAQNLLLLADTFHMNIEEVDLEAGLAAAGARLGHVHLADTNRQAPGRGHLNVGSILRTLDRLGYAKA